MATMRVPVSAMAVKKTRQRVGAVWTILICRFSSISEQTPIPTLMKILFFYAKETATTMITARVISFVIKERTENMSLDAGTTPGSSEEITITVQTRT